MASRKKEIEPEVPRPKCSSCGEPAHHRVAVYVYNLILDREAGMKSQPIWQPNFRAATCIETQMCESCVRKQVTISVTASSTVKGERL